MRRARMALRKRSPTDGSVGWILGVFARVKEGLASEGSEQKTIMIDATYL